MVGKDNEFEYSMDGQVQATNPKQLPTRPLTFPPLPDQMGESDKGSVLCPVPRCKGRFTNHDSLSYHCLVEHSELGAAGTPQDFSIRQYRFENKEELKVCGSKRRSAFRDTLMAMKCKNSGLAV